MTGKKFFPWAQLQKDIKSFSAENPKIGKEQAKKFSGNLRCAILLAEWCLFLPLNGLMT